MRVVTIFAATLALAACAPPPSKTPAEANRIARSSGVAVDRIADKENGIVCYMTTGNASPAISCVLLPKAGG